MYLQKHKIQPEKIISQEEDSVVLELSITPECDFFDGHFPQISLVPAVAQIDIVTKFIKKYFGLSGVIESAKRLKFSSPIFPNSVVQINLKYNSEKKSVSYKLSSANSEKIYSSGAIVVK